MKSNIRFGLRQKAELEQRPIVDTRDQLRVPLQEIVQSPRRLLLPDLAQLPVVVLEVASVAVFALACQEERLAVLGAEVRVQLAILQELLEPVGKATLRPVGTAARRDEVFAELYFHLEVLPLLALRSSP